jgi:hypothetical protein
MYNCTVMSGHHHQRNTRVCQRPAHQLPYQQQQHYVSSMYMDPLAPLYVRSSSAYPPKKLETLEQLGKLINYQGVGISVVVFFSCFQCIISLF